MYRHRYEDVLAVILGGGRGSRLYPLTQQRAKPAVPIGGKYRLIDIPISNSINSEINHIAVLTQFNSVSLHRHISQTYNFDHFHRGYVQIWAAEQTTASKDWYQGTADAVRKQIFEIQAARRSYTLILSGDHLYRMDYRKLCDFAWQNDADVAVAVQPVSREDATRFGILKCEADHTISEFAEKPKDPAHLDRLISIDDPQKPYLGSMGIYLFRTEWLTRILTESDFEDFGSHVIPHAIQNCKVVGYPFEGYWEDIGTIRSFYDTNLALADKDAAFNFFDPESPIYTHMRFLPGSIVEHCQTVNAVITDGCTIVDAEITRSLVGVRSKIGRNVRITDSVLMGCDYYDSDHYAGGNPIPLGIGSGTQITGAIVDKNVRIGENVIIEPFPNGTEIDNHLYYVRDGIVVIPKGTTIPAGTYIGPKQ
ncbi:MAG: glucose-1-phosphate adenylyltransferase [Anaerolineaceae bacterium]|nr:glucose-1-phosphate adenylyltransferase [Anaerolineaceae bacterium]